MNRFHVGRIVAAALAAAIGAASASAAPVERTFASPDEAVAALRAAVDAHDKVALDSIFGPDAPLLLSGDGKRDDANFTRLSRAMGEGAKAVSERNGTMTLEIGRNQWPFPVPLVKDGDSWRFDMATGKEAIINRRIGKDELHAIAACRSFAARSGGTAPASYHGYAFKSLDFGGYVLAAYPEIWGTTGIMTFVVAKDGTVYQRDLGERTAEHAGALSQFDPKADWTVVAEPGITEK
jgi:hypothetical protein